MNEISEPLSKMTRVLMLLMFVVNVCKYCDTPPELANAEMTDASFEIDDDVHGCSSDAISVFGMV